MRGNKLSEPLSAKLDAGIFYLERHLGVTLHSPHEENTTFLTPTSVRQPGEPEVCKLYSMKPKCPGWSPRPGCSVVKSPDGPHSQHCCLTTALPDTGREDHLPLLALMSIPGSIQSEGHGQASSSRSRPPPLRCMPLAR